MVHGEKVRFPKIEQTSFIPELVTSGDTPSSPRNGYSWTLLDASHAFRASKLGSDWYYRVHEITLKGSKEKNGQK